MTLPVIKNLFKLAGVDPRRIDTVQQFPMGQVAEDQFGQIYKYVKVATDLSIGDADVDSLPVTFTYTLDKGTSGLQAGTVDGDGSVNGTLGTIVAAASANSDRVDGILERRVSGTGVQIDGTPTARYIWVKVKGIANRMLKAAALDADQPASRLLVAGALTEATIDLDGTGVINAPILFGICIAEHTTTAGAGLAGDFLFDVS